jgi:hypothetical protein
MRPTPDRWTSDKADGEAEDLVRRHESVVRRIARVDAAIARWHDWKANQARPPDDWLPITPPDLSLTECLAVRRLLDEELDRLGCTGR